jgi:C-terminal processing protease CtpA/Prc
MGKVLQYKLKSCENHKLEMSDFEQWNDMTNSNQNINQSSLLPYSFTFYKEDKIAIFEFNSFSNDGDITKAKEEFEFFDKDIAKAIDTLNMYNISHLFVDITRNRGGSTNFADIFLDYLDIPRKTYSGEITNKISDAVREMAGLNTGKKNLKTLSSRFYRDIMFTRKGKTVTRKYYYIKNKKTVSYKGNIYLIQSNATFSAAIRLSALFKYYKFGTIFGEETSGLTACYIQSYDFELPNSKLVGYCSTQKSVEPGGKWDGRGVLPDIEYEIESIDKKFTLVQLKEMLRLDKKYKALINNNKVDKWTSGQVDDLTKA